MADAETILDDSDQPVQLHVLLTAALFTFKEVCAMQSGEVRGVSFLAHLTGGIAGALLGYLANLGLARKAARGGGIAARGCKHMD